MTWDAGTHPAGGAEGSTAGCGTVASGNAANAPTDLPTAADAARVRTMTTVTEARNLTVATLPRSSDGMIPGKDIAVPLRAVKQCPLVQ